MSIAEKRVVHEAAKQFGWERQDTGLYVKPFTGVAVDTDAEDVEPGTAKITAPLSEIPKIMQYQETAAERDVLHQQVEQLTKASRQTLTHLHEVQPYLAGGSLSVTPYILLLQEAISTTPQQTTAPAMVTVENATAKHLAFLRDVQRFQGQYTDGWSHNGYPGEVDDDDVEGCITRGWVERRMHWTNGSSGYPVFRLTLAGEHLLNSPAEAPHGS